MGRNRNAQTATKRHRKVESRIAREARKDDEARKRLGHPAEQMIVIFDETMDDGDEWDYR